MTGAYSSPFPPQKIALLFYFLLVRKQGSPIHNLLLLVAVRHVHVIVVQFNFGKHRVHGNFSGPRPILRFHSLPV